MFATNTTLSTVQRKDEVDQYGRPTHASVYSDIRCWMEVSFSKDRSAEGDRGTAPATLFIDDYYDLKIGDIVTVDNAAEDKYSILSTTEQYDIAGSVLARSYSLMRQR